MISYPKSRSLLFASVLTFAFLVPATLDESIGADQGRRAYQILDSTLRVKANDDIPDKCGLPLIAHAYREREHLTDVQQHALDQLLQRPLLQRNILVGNFRIHYDTSGLHTAAMLDDSLRRIPGSAHRYADSVGAIANRVYAQVTNELGYLPPPEDFGAGGGVEYDIYVMELGSLYGETVFEQQLDNKPNGNRFTTFIRIDNDFIFVFPDSNKGMPGLRVTLAHEFHHAIQLGAYAFWTGDIFFYEITSTWMEDAIFPQVNDYFQYVKSGMGHFKRPEVPFITSNGVIEYSRCIWGLFLAKRFGPDAIRRSWEEIRFQRPLVAMDNALQQYYETSFRSAFTEWTVWNYYTGARTDSVRYYPESRYYPLVLSSGVEFVPPARSVTGTLGPLGSRYYDVMLPGGTMALTLSNVNLAEAIANSTTPSPYTYHLNVNRIDDSYSQTSGGIFLKLSVSDPTNWFSKDIQGSANLVAPFPNPFRVDGKGSIHFPFAGAATRGTLAIYSSSMDLVYVESTASIFSPQINQQVFRWNGKTTNGEIAGTGVYLYFIETPTQVITGKFALIRK